MKKKEKHDRKKYFICMAGIFFFLLAGGLMLHIIFPDRKISVEENRVLADFPIPDKNTVLSGKYEKDFEAYCNDQFPARNLFIRIKTMADEALGKKEANDVVLGEDSYLMEKFLPAEEKILEDKYEKMRAYMKKYPQIRQYLLIAPTAVNIMRDKLPKGVPLADQDAYMDDAFRNFSDMGGRIIDVRETLVKDADREVFYHTDHHWTSYGAYISARRALDAMGFSPDVQDYEAMPVYDGFRGSLSYKSGFLQDVTDVIEVYFPMGEEEEIQVNYVEEKVKTGSIYNHEKLNTRESYEVFLDGNHSLVKISTALENKRKLLLIKDSYANCFIPFLLPCFQEIVVLDPRYFYDDLCELTEIEEITDVLYLYNANTFFSEKSLNSVLTLDEG